MCPFLPASDYDIIKKPTGVQGTLTHDIIKGKYEGGAKVWECTADLVNKVKCLPITKGTVILELGCGAGLVGIECLKLGAEVYFQDYNEDVIKTVTLTHVIEDVNQEGISRAKFWYGPWSQLKYEITGMKFDYIVGSEILYDADCYDYILSTLSFLSDDGQAIIASKNFYFGLSGNIYDFTVKAREMGFQVASEVMAATEIPRSILSITRRLQG